MGRHGKARTRSAANDYPWPDLAANTSNLAVSASEAPPAMSSRQMSAFPVWRAAASKFAGCNLHSELDLRIGVDHSIHLLRDAVRLSQGP
jgi:hypothetical protein